GPVGVGVPALAAEVVGAGVLEGIGLAAVVGAVELARVVVDRGIDDGGIVGGVGQLDAAFEAGDGGQAGGGGPGGAAVGGVEGLAVAAAGDGLGGVAGVEVHVEDLGTGDRGDVGEGHALVSTAGDPHGGGVAVAHGGEQGHAVLGDGQAVDIDERGPSRRRELAPGGATIGALEDAGTPKAIDVIESLAGAGVE